MNDRFRVSPGYVGPGVVLGGFFAGVFLLFGWMGEGRESKTDVWWYLGGGLLALVLLRLAYVWSRSKWITPTRDGLVLEDRSGQTFVKDEQVLDLAFSSRTHYDSGRPKATENRGRLTYEIDGRPKMFAFRHHAPLGRSDALEAAFERVLTALTDRARQALPSQPWTGAGWEYDPSGLSFDEGRGRRSLAGDEIAAVDMMDGNVYVWAAGETMPCLRVPAGSPGALVLGRLLAKQLQDRPRIEGEETEGLGRVLFERGRSGVRLGRVAIAILIGTWVTALASWALGYTLVTTMAVVLGIVTSPLFLVAWISESNLLRCCVRGVYRRNVWGATELKYEDVGSFSYGATRRYVKGIYSGTTIEMRFRPLSRAAGRDVTFKANLDGGDDELDRLRDHIAHVIADRMARRLANGKEVEWAPAVRFRPDGLELTARVGLLRRTEVWVLPYGRVAGTEFKEGQFFLFERGRKKPVYQTPVSSENFFPGFVLLQRILAAPSTPAASGEPAYADRN